MTSAADREPDVLRIVVYWLMPAMLLTRTWADGGNRREGPIYLLLFFFWPLFILCMVQVWRHSRGASARVRTVLVSLLFAYVSLGTWYLVFGGGGASTVW